MIYISPFDPNAQRDEQKKPPLRERLHNLLQSIRGFMRNSQLLILDEPTASLDAKAEYELFSQIRELTRGRTAIFISHRFSTVRLADHILVLENGSVIEYGSHSELLTQNGHYAELFNLQAEAYR